MKNRWDKIEDPSRNFLYGDIIEDQGPSKLGRGLVFIVLKQNLLLNYKQV
jgi:hypothetical protein